MSLRVEHGFEPVFDENSKVLILGTMPSVKSREQGFYYGHPQNRFWRVIAAITASGGTGADTDSAIYVPQTIGEKRAMLLRAGIAVWDVLAACEIEGSEDSSIRNPEPADLQTLLHNAPGIRAIFCNGDKACKLYLKFFAAEAAVGGWPQAVKLPSTSPANAAWDLSRLTETWGIAISKYL